MIIGMVIHKGGNMLVLISDAAMKGCRPSKCNFSFLKPEYLYGVSAFAPRKLIP